MFVAGAALKDTPIKASASFLHSSFFILTSTSSETKGAMMQSMLLSEHEHLQLVPLRSGSGSSGSGSESEYPQYFLIYTSTYCDTFKATEILSLSQRLAGSGIRTQAQVG